MYLYKTSFYCTVPAVQYSTTVLEQGSIQSYCMEVALPVHKSRMRFVYVRSVCQFVQRYLQYSVQYSRVYLIYSTSWLGLGLGLGCTFIQYGTEQLLLSESKSLLYTLYSTVWFTYSTLSTVYSTVYVDLVSSR